MLLVAYISRKMLHALTACCFNISVSPVEDSNDLLIPRAGMIHSKDEEEINMKTTKRASAL